VAELFERLEPLLEHNCLGCYHSTGGELFLLEVVEDFLAFLLAFVGEKERPVALQVLCSIKPTSEMR
jgi:hypothetical protein